MNNSMIQLFKQATSELRAACQCITKLNDKEKPLFRGRQCCLINEVCIEIHLQRELLTLEECKKAKPQLALLFFFVNLSHTTPQSHS